MHKRHLGICSLVTFTLLLVYSHLVLGATVDVGGVGFHVNLGFAGHFRPATWVPLQVTVTNEGVPLNAYVEAVTTVGGYLLSSSPSHVIYRRPVNLPSGTRKQFFMTLPLPDANRTLDVRLVESHGSVLHTVRLPLRAAAVTSDIVLVLDTIGERWTWLQEVAPQLLGAVRRSRVYVTHIQDAANLPTEWMAYESVRTVILTATFPLSSLSRNQMTALLNWVEAGGHLLVVGGPSLNALAVPELVKILPVQVTGSTQVITIKTLGLTATALNSPLRTLAWSAKPAMGHVDLTADGIPLVAHRWVGTGRITYIGFDLAAAPWRSWQGLDAYSRSLVFPPRMIRRTTNTIEHNLLPLLSHQRVPYPRHIGIVVFALIYIAGIAGGLKTVRTHPAGWVLLLSVIVLGSLYSHIVIRTHVNRSLRAYGEIRISEVSPTGGQAHSIAIAQMVNMHGGYWSMQQQTGVLYAPANVRQSSSNSILTVEHGDTEIKMGPTAPGQTLAVTGLSLQTIPIQITTTRDNEFISLAIENHSPWLIRNAFYIDKQRYIPIGHVRKGLTHITKVPANPYIYATDTLSPEWIAASVATVAAQQAPDTNKQELEALKQVVTQALTPHRETYDYPWGLPLMVASIDTPVQPPISGSYTGLGYHLIIIPLSSLFETD